MSESRPGSDPAQQLRYLAGVTALALTVADVGAILALVLLGREFSAAVTTGLGFVGAITATLFVYSGLGGQLAQVHKQVNGNLSREVERADAVIGELARLAGLLPGAVLLPPGVLPDPPGRPDAPTEEKA